MRSMINILPQAPYSSEGWPWNVETDPDLYNVREHWPKITIITPSYQQSQYIEETIRSILLQNYPKLEYIVIDGGSTDGSVDIIRKYEPWLSYWISEKDRGQSHAINKGIEYASGEIIQWINSDDVLRSGSLFEVAQKFINHTFCNCLLAPTWAFGQVNRILDPTPVYPVLSKTVSAARINQPGTFFRADAFRSITPLREDLHYMMDLHMWLRYLMKFGTSQIMTTDHLLVDFREHELSKTVSQEINFFKDRFYLLSHLQKYLIYPDFNDQLFGSLQCDQETKKEFLSGISDSLLFWWKHFKKLRNSEMTDIIRPVVMTSYLSWIDRFRFWLNF